MKKIIGITLCCFLTSCYHQSLKVDTGPSPSTNYPLQGTAPLPWVQVLPTKRTIAFKDVDFHIIAQQLRFDMHYFPHKSLKNVTLVLVDYAILPAEPPKKRSKEVIQNYVSYSLNYEPSPERYTMTMRFYECDQYPPARPLFEETIYMPTSKAPPLEALRLMAVMLIEDYHASTSIKKMVDTLH